MYWDQLERIKKRENLMVFFGSIFVCVCAALVRLMCSSRTKCDFRERERVENKKSLGTIDKCDEVSILLREENRRPTI